MRRGRRGGPLNAADTRARRGRRQSARAARSQVVVTADPLVEAVMRVQVNSVEHRHPAATPRADASPARSNCWVDESRWRSRLSIPIRSLPSSNVRAPRQEDEPDRGIDRRGSSGAGAAASPCMSGPSNIRSYRCERDLRPGRPRPTLSRTRRPVPTRRGVSRWTIDADDRSWQVPSAPFLPMATCSCPPAEELERQDGAGEWSCSPGSACSCASCRR